MQEQSLFIAALEVEDPAARAAFLEQACAGDAGLRQRIDRLLARHLESESFLRPPAQLTSTVDDAVHARPGIVIGPYKLMEEIGEGGMGLVFVAEQQHPVRRKVALKVIKPGMDTRHVVARFEAERQALALMDHPNIAKVLDGGATEQGRPYFVMELVKGVPITTFCDAAHLPVRARLGLFLDICAAVQHAHQKGIIHRDLKPGNVLVTSHDGTPVVKVIDFGVAKAVAQQLTEKTLYTQLSQLVGTPLYMSPEQAGQSGLDIDTRTDIYALGVLLYELLTGTTPFDSERLRTAGLDEMRRILREEEPLRPSTRISTLGAAAATASVNRQSEPRKLSQLVRGELDWIVMKALEKDRNRRYESANSFAADVRRYLADEPVLACPPSAAYRLRKLVRRHQGPVVAFALVLLALVGGVIGTTWGLIHTSRARADAVDEAAQKNRALEEKVAALASAERSAGDAKEQLFLALLNQARSGRFSRKMGQRFDSLAGLEKAARLRPGERLRDEAIAAMALPDVRLGPALDVAPAGTVGWWYDDHYRCYARIDGEGTVRIHTIADGKETRRINTGVKSRSTLVWWGPDGHYLGLIHDGDAAQIWRVADGQAMLREPPRGCSTLAFSPDGRQVVIACSDRLLAFEVAKGEETARWRVPAAVHKLAYHPTARTLAVGYAAHDVASIYDTGQGRHVADLPVGSMHLLTIAWHPDGARLAVAGSDPRIQIWDVARRRRLATLEGHVEQVTLLSFHPEGSLLASSSWEGTLRLWEPGTGRQLMKVACSGATHFSRCGRWLGYLWPGGGQIQLLEANLGREYRTLVSSLGAGRGGFHDGDISPDGRLLSVGMGRDGARLWDLSSGKQLAVLPARSESVSFHPGAGELLTAGPSGLYSWPLREGRGGANQLHLGPPVRVPLPVAPTRFVRSRSGERLAIVSESAGAALLVERGAKPAVGKLLAHPRACFLDLSADGRWLATSGWQSDRVKLWDAATGALVHEWAPGTQTVVYFTPDSRSVVLCRGDEYSFWDVGTYKCVRRLRRDIPHNPGRVAFSPDGKLMALEMAPAVIHLMEVASARTVAKLEDPHGDRGGWMGFTPDSGRLVVVAQYAQAIHVWDLRSIRGGLKLIGVDWKWPELPPASPGREAAKLAHAEVIPGELARPNLTREQQARQAIDHYRRAVKAQPDNAKACNGLAWFYATAPEALRDVKAAVPLAENAVRLEPQNAVYRNTLGVAYYRAGRYREAVKVLRGNVETQPDWALAFDLYFLAMSHQRLGEADRARDYYDWAGRWARAQRGLSAGHLAELAEFRAEAEGLLAAGGEKEK